MFNVIVNIVPDIIIYTSLNIMCMMMIFNYIQNICINL